MTKEKQPIVTNSAVPFPSTAIAADAAQDRADVEGEETVPEPETLREDSHPPVPALWKDKSEETDYVVSSGRGTVFSFVVHHAPRVPGRTRFPFVIALIELDEGVRLMSNIVGVEPLPENLPLGMRVSVEFEPRGDQFLPVFTPESRS